MGWDKKFYFILIAVRIHFYYFKQESSLIWNCFFYNFRGISSGFLVEINNQQNIIKSQTLCCRLVLSNLKSLKILENIYILPPSNLVDWYERKRIGFMGKISCNYFTWLFFRASWLLLMSYYKSSLDVKICFQLISIWLW